MLWGPKDEGERTVCASPRYVKEERPAIFAEGVMLVGVELRIRAGCINGEEAEEGDKLRVVAMSDRRPLREVAAPDD